jgi:hypothetical protein
MKWSNVIKLFGICLVFCFLFTSNAYGEFIPYTPLPEINLDPPLKSTPNPIPEGIPTATLPISNLLEVRKDLIRKEGNAFPGGWSEYYLNYKLNSGQEFYDKKADPFDYVGVALYTLEMYWVETLAIQDVYFENDQWAEEEHRENLRYHSKSLAFQIFLGCDSLNLLEKKNLRFVYQDSTGERKDGIIVVYKLDETKKPIYKATIELDVPLCNNFEEITWFSMHILNKKTAGRVDMCWEFKKN